MADDPLFGFRPVAAAPDPLMGYTPTTAPPAASSDIAQPGDSLGNMSALDPRAANSSWKDFLLAHLSELGKGASQLGGAASDYARPAANVYGEGDSTLASLKALAGDVTGQTKGTDYLTNLAAAKGDTAAASARLCTPGTIAATLTGGGPLGSLSEGAGTMAAPYLGKWAAACSARPQSAAARPQRARLAATKAYRLGISGSAR